jgi:plastocyanin
MKSGQRLNRSLMLSTALLFTLLTFGGASSAPSSGSPETILIEYQDHGFSVQRLTVSVGTAVTWRNNTDTPLNLRGDAFQNTIYLPLILTGGSGAVAQQTSKTEMGHIASASAANGFETLVAPGGEFSYQINTIGRFEFFDLAAPQVRGQIIVTPLTRIYRGDDGSFIPAYRW